ncbi:hypothetical protein GCM10027258_04020 [Amycolatopsis stemonae]
MRYSRTQARPYTAIVGDGRRLATELVVIKASATQEIQVGAGLAGRPGWCCSPLMGIAPRQEFPMAPTGFRPGERFRLARQG